MKKIILSLILFAGITSMAISQNIRLNGYAAYVFDDKVDSYYSQTDQYWGQINGGLQ